MLVAMLMVAQVVLDPPAKPRTIGPLLPPSTTLVRSCPPKDGDSDDVVVCGKSDSERYRLRPIGPPPNGTPLPPMTAKVGNGTIDSHAEQHCVGGFCGPAAMVRLKLPF
ncbi:MAG: hypothetical protein J0I47_00305 [Sphingomonas sp.]|uniref:hypothetical protein n=1 Tax=Sphingomonas sp. TaxID=28214 RepID=UPI001AC01A08|nr:hypothetical protein [Sphingomonas sp.]MBN8806669.1 hypothetical protein [Sphingomonas sp.]